MAGFFKLTLRTNDIDGARAFYRRVLGDRAVEVVPLPAQAIARGGRPHWLGYLDVGDVDRAAAAFVARGAVPLGPKSVDADGLEAAVVRDPGGAVVALAKPPAPPRPLSNVAFYELNTADLKRAKASYHQLFGWVFERAVALGDFGVLHFFRWAQGGAPVGAMRDSTKHPGVHAHWLFHFGVDGLDPAIDAVRAAGGLVVGPIALPSGARIAVCDDPQGATFALREAALRTRG